MSDFAWETFGQGPTGWGRVQAVCDFVHDHVTFGYEHSRATRTAAETLAEGVGGSAAIFTHLRSRLCRSLNNPTRYCNRLRQRYRPADTSCRNGFRRLDGVYLGPPLVVFDPRNKTR